MNLSHLATMMRAMFVLAALLVANTGAWATDSGRVCSSTADTLLNACDSDTQDNYLVATVKCQNLADANARKDCLVEAQATREDDTSNCRNVYQARLAVCKAVGEGSYDPPFGPDYAKDFVDPLQIGGSVKPNPYYPLRQGSQWEYLTTYKNENGDQITENDTVTVTDRTKLINGITCLVVTDVVQASDGTVEKTGDWYAQDKQGNVWYCGEIAQQKQIFQGDKPPKPELVSIDGSWKTGREGAKPGIQMLARANLKVGKSYRQELAWGEAEDVADVLALNANESVSHGAFNCNSLCVETHDYSGLEPNADEHKYYAPNVGLILEVDLSNGARNELISYTTTHP